MEKLVSIFLFGKKYEVPENLTIMTAMEYAGYQLVRGCGCRNGFCGACATIYRIKGDKELKACLACQTKVEDNMYIATLPFFPLVKEVYDIEKIPVNETVMMQLYPEIYACIGCNACTKSCTQGLNVMQYIAPSPLVFLLISTHFTATLGIPLSSPALKFSSFKSLLRFSRSLSLLT